MIQKKKLQNYSKWFQILDRLSNLMISAGIISTIVIIISGNGYAYIADVIVTFFIIIWLITFFAESFLHLSKHN
ncbi:hypothetical protein FD05_GL001928 [Lentilactobacillus otakiensis DSM 19908 = JCM 15040]|nr:hypothetical protein FD05_GL001928 [Lentilactobacillus otakiensis DSM 19908 = JCM 15040]